VLALWMPRFARAADWFIGYESARRKNIARSLVEVKGKMPIGCRLGFELRGRADRIDILADGSAAVLDYKSGRVPSKRQMERLLSPQLALEGAMLLAGAFGGVQPSSLSDFVHIRLSGGDPPGEDKPAGLDANGLANKAHQLLSQMVARYEDQSQGYPSWALRELVGDTGDYDHLARVLEWSLADEAEA
jgi:ATP-dependent helicase/nuclease subunit B